MPIHRAPNLDLSAIAHGFFTRDGGTSQGLYESLNCGLGSRDEPERVKENRARAVSALLPEARLVSCSQIHSAIVHTVDDKWDFAVRQEGDGLVTNRPGFMLGILTADCAPVLMADNEAGVIGAAHAGWKGAVAGILETTVAAMTRLGARPSRIRAAIGPTISQANYEVGEDLRVRFGDKEARFFVAAGPRHYRFDLPGFVAQRLREAGVPSVADLGLCTYPPANRFFSYRRATHRGEADYGRELSAIVLLPKG